MNQFEVIFLTEAREFLLELDEKAREKIVFNTRKAKAKNDREVFKKLKGKFGNFEPYITKNILGSLPFGIKPTKQKHWSWQPTG